MSAYDTAVLADSPEYYFPLNETSGTALTDLTTFGAIASYYGSVAYSQPALLPADPQLCIGLNGFSAYASRSNADPNPQTFTVELWFRTTAVSQIIIGGNSNPTPTVPGSYDRLVYMDATGKLWFGWYTGFSGAAGTPELTSTATYNDGVAHHMVVTFSSASANLYVDGSLVASLASPAPAQNYNVYWILGYAIFGAGNWPDTISAGGTSYFSGTLQKWAYWTGGVLSATRVAAHYAAAQLSGATITLSDVGPTISDTFTLAAAQTAISLTDTGPAIWDTLTFTVTTAIVLTDIGPVLSDGFAEAEIVPTIGLSDLGPTLSDSVAVAVGTPIVFMDLGPALSDAVAVTASSSTPVIALIDAGPAISDSFGLIAHLPRSQAVGNAASPGGAIGNGPVPGGTA